MKYLKDLRKRARLSQEKLADIMDVHLNTIWAWENNNERGPNPQQLIKLCEALNVTETELLNGPSNETWELKLIFRKEKETEGGVIDMSGNTISAALAIGDHAMSVELGAPFEIWEDDAKFEGLIEQLRAKRAAGLKARKEGW